MSVFLQYLRLKFVEQVYNNSAQDNGRLVIPAFDGGYVIAGFTAPKGKDTWDAWLIKVDDNGNKLWDRVFYPESSEYHSGYCMTQSIDGGYVITGDVLPVGSAAWDAWLVKVDANGS